MSAVSFKAQVVGEAKLLSMLYPAAIILGVASSFVTHFTSLKIVTSAPPQMEAPAQILPKTEVPAGPADLQAPPLQRKAEPLPLERTIWEYGFPEPIEPAAAVVASAATKPLPSQTSWFFWEQSDPVATFDWQAGEAYSFDTSSTKFAGMTANGKAAWAGSSGVLFYDVS